MKALLLKALDLLRYPSTWQGIITALTAAGVALTPDQSAAIVAFGVAAVGVAGTFLGWSDAHVEPAKKAKK